MVHLMPPPPTTPPPPPARVITLDALAEREDRESELWTWVARPEGPEGRREREHLLRLWRAAKRAAYREGGTPTR